MKSKKSMDPDRVLPIRELWKLESKGYTDFEFASVEFSNGFARLIRSKILEHRSKILVKAVLDVDNRQILFVFASKVSPRGSKGDDDFMITDFGNSGFRYKNRYQKR